MTEASGTRIAQPVRPDRDGDGGAPQSPPRRRRRPGPAVFWGAVAVAIVAAVIGWLVVRDDSSSSDGSTSEPATTTAEVERRDLVETDSVNGTLAYAGSRSALFFQPGVSGKGSGSGSASDDDSNRSSGNASYEPDGEGSDTTLVAYREAEGTDPITDVIPTIDGTTEPAPTTSASTEPAPTTGSTEGETTPAPSTESGSTEPAPSTGETPSTGGASGETPPTGETTTGETPSSGAGATTDNGRSSGASVPSGSTSSGGSTQAATATETQGASGSSSAGGQTTIVTWLPAEGKTIDRGQVLYRVDGKATYLMYGETPTYRTLKEGIVDGADVKQLELNLVAMGYDKGKDVTVDQHFGPATKAAVKRWQKAIGVKQTGVVKLGTVLFLPGERRVGTLDVSVGDSIQSGSSVMTTTTTRQVVTVALETTKQTLVAEGDGVSVELPDGTEVPGTVASIGRVATSSSATTDTQGGQSTGQEQQASSDATIDVTITLDEASGVDLDQAPVDVQITQEEATDVLAVPVTALVALAGGGYAVEVVDSATATHLVHVEPGLYADGYVEVTGDGIDEGSEVVVPA